MSVAGARGTRLRRRDIVSKIFAPEFYSSLNYTRRRIARIQNANFEKPFFFFFCETRLGERGGRGGMGETEIRTPRFGEMICKFWNLLPPRSKVVFIKIQINKYDSPLEKNRLKDK